jgi:alpha/beta superfamily hydrolase
MDIYSVSWKQCSRNDSVWPASIRVRYHWASLEAMYQDMTEARTFEQPERFPDEHREFFIRGPAGVIECATDVPEPGSEVPATVIICHPHPLHSGTMRNKVVTIMERSMRELGLRTVRFNFRGAGESEGEHDDAYGETDDLFAVAEWVRRTRPDDHLWLAGFSFGAYVALRAALNLDTAQLITIAPPVDRYPFDSLHHPECPWLVIQGDEDEIVNIDVVKHWAGTLKPPPELVVMQEADHFFHRRLMDLRGLLKNGVREQLPASVNNPESL